MKIAKVITNVLKSGTKKLTLQIIGQFSSLATILKNLGDIVSYQNKQLFMCQQHFKFESIRVPHKFVYVTGGDGID